MLEQMKTPKVVNKSRRHNQHPSSGDQLKMILRSGRVINAANSTEGSAVPDNTQRAIRRQRNRNTRENAISPASSTGSLPYPQRSRNTRGNMDSTADSAESVTNSQHNEVPSASSGTSGVPNPPHATTNRFNRVATASSAGSATNLGRVSYIRLRIPEAAGSTGSVTASDSNTRENVGFPGFWVRLALPPQYGPRPPSQRAIDRICTAKVTAEDVQNQSRCSICLENFLIEQPVSKLPCAHIFHPICIMPWLHQHSSCPNCRRLLNMEEDETDDAEESTSTSNAST